MAPSTVLDDELVAEFADIARHAGCELLHCEYRGGALRVFLDHPERAVTLSDCETVSKEISAFLDVTDFGRARYTLEVSTPGLDRQLYGPRDYERFRGRAVRVTFTERTPESGGRGHKKTLVGRLEAFDPGPQESSGLAAITLAGEDGRQHGIPLADIKIARLEIEL